MACRSRVPTSAPLTDADLKAGLLREVDLFAIVAPNDFEVT